MTRCVLLLACCRGPQAAKAAKKASEFEEHKAINAEVVARLTAPYRCGQHRDVASVGRDEESQQRTSLYMHPLTCACDA